MALGGRDTSMGGGGHLFPSTRWSEILTTEDSATRNEALRALAYNYWKPIYSYLRSQWSKSNEEAKDLTQHFFLWMIEKRFLDRVDRARGRFRVFLKMSLRHFIHNIYRSEHQLKRGGDRGVVPLPGPDPKWDPPDPAGKTPEELFDEAWRSQMLAQAVERLQERLVSEGKSRYYEVFRDYYLRGVGETDYSQLSTRLGIKTTDIDNYLRHSKACLRAIIEELIAVTVGTPEELRTEFDELMGDKH